MAIPRKDIIYIMDKIIELYGSFTYKRIADKLTEDTNCIGKFTESMVVYYVTKLQAQGIVPPKLKPITDDEIKIFKRLYLGKVPIKTIAVELNRSVASIHYLIKCYHLANREINDSMKTKIFNELSSARKSLLETALGLKVSYNAVKNIWNKHKADINQKRRITKYGSSSIAEEYIRNELTKLYGNAVIPSERKKDWSNGRYEIDIQIKLPWGNFAIEIQSPYHADKKFKDYYKQELISLENYIFIPIWFWKYPNITQIQEAIDLIIRIIDERKEGKINFYNSFIKKTRKLEQEVYYDLDQEIYDPKSNAPLGKLWSKAESMTLIDNYNKTSIKDIQSMLSSLRSLDAIKHKARSLGIAKTRLNYSLLEDNLIKKYYNNASKDKLLTLLRGRSWVSICSRAHRLGITRKSFYTLDEDKMIFNLYNSCNKEVMMKSLPERTWPSIVSHAYRLRKKDIQIL